MRVSLGTIRADPPFPGSPEERLHLVLTKAKESGLSTEKIFSFFRGHADASSDRLSKERFLSALEGIGNDLFVLSDSALDDLVRNFSAEDGSVSLAAFEAYCRREIPSLPWRAERHRAERAALPPAGVDPVAVPCGPQVWNTAKVFWKSGVSLSVELFHAEDLDVVTLRSSREGDVSPSPCLHVRKSSVDRRLREEGGAADWGARAAYLLARLKLRSGSTPVAYLDALVGEFSRATIELVLIARQATTGPSPYRNLPASWIPPACPLRPSRNFGMRWRISGQMLGAPERVDDPRRSCPPRWRRF